MNKSYFISSLKMCLVLSSLTSTPVPPPPPPTDTAPRVTATIQSQATLFYRCCSCCESLSAGSHLAVSLGPVFDFWLSLCFSLWSRRSLICCVELETIFLRTLCLLNLFFTLCPRLCFLFILCLLVLCAFFFSSSSSSSFSERLWAPWGISLIWLRPSWRW